MSGYKHMPLVPIKIYGKEGVIGNSLVQHGLSVILKQRDITCILRSFVSPLQVRLSSSPMAQPEWVIELQKAFEDIGGVIETCCVNWAKGKDAQEAIGIVSARLTAIFSCQKALPISYDVGQFKKCRRSCIAAVTTR